MDVSEFLAEAPQATASEGLAQGPYVAARTEFEPTTLRSTAIDSTNELPRLSMQGLANCFSALLTVSCVLH